MSNAGDTLQRASDIIASSLTQYADQLSTEAGARALLEELGWLEVPTVPSALLALGTALQGLATARAELEEALTASDDGTQNDSSVLTAIGKVVTFLGFAVAATSRLKETTINELPLGYRDTTGIADNIERRVTDFILVDLLHDNFPLVTRVLEFLGIVEEEDIDADETIFRPNFLLRQLNWSRLSLVFQGPSAIMADVYGWGTPTLKIDKLFDALQSLSYQLMFPARIEYASEAFLNAITPGATASLPRPMLILPLATLGGASLNLGVLAAPKLDPNEAEGLAFHLIGSGTFNEAFPVTDSVTLTVSADVDLTLGAGAVLRDELSIVTDPDGQPAAFAGGKILGRVSRKVEEDEEPVRLLTFPGGAFLDAQELFFEAGIDATGSSPDIFVRAGASGARFAIPTADRDAFTSNVTSRNSVKANFDFAIGWSRLRGVFFNGSGGIEAALQINKTIGPFTIQMLRLKIAPSSGGLSLDAGVVGSAKLGPVTAVIDALGVSGDLQFRSGNLGALNLDIGFAAPTGYGIFIESSSVSGGGFLFFDEPKGRYGGALELRAYDIDVKAFGLIETKVPGVSFSFVIVISAEFNPIQLGLGFTLDGVGGFIGINRGVDAKALDGPGARRDDRSRPVPAQRDRRTRPRSSVSWRRCSRRRGGSPQSGRWRSSAGARDRARGRLGPHPRVAREGLTIIGERQRAPAEAGQRARRPQHRTSREASTSRRSTSRWTRPCTTRASAPSRSRATWRRGSTGATSRTSRISMGGFNPHFTPPPGFPTLRRMPIDSRHQRQPDRHAAGVHGADLEHGADWRPAGRLRVGSARR